MALHGVAASFSGVPASFLAIAIVVAAILVVASLLPFTWIQWSRAIVAAGALKIRVVRPRVRRWNRIMDLVFAMIIAAFLVSLFVEGVKRQDIFPGIYILMGLALWWMPRLTGLDPYKLEVREKGIVHLGRFSPWECVKSYRWKEGKIPTLILQFSKFGFSNFGVAAEQRAAIDEILRPHVPGPANSPAAK